MHSRIAAIATSLTALAGTLFAQAPVTIRGEITTTGSAHTIKFTKTQLVSSSVNLGTLAGRTIMLVGTWNGVVIDVLRAQVEIQSFSIGGVPRLGGQLEFTTGGAPGDFAVNAVGFSTGFDLLGDQALLLSSRTGVVLGAGVVGRSGDFTSKVSIPNVPSLVGLEVFGQGLVVPQAAAFFTTNLDSQVIT